MNLPLESKIMHLEEELREAMLQSDISTLDKLLSPQLIFTTHLGQILSKENDLDAHSSGLIKIHELILSEQNIQVFDRVAVVTVKVHLAGSYAGERSEGDFRFTRIWRLGSDGAWQVAVGHASAVV